MLPKLVGLLTCLLVLSARAVTIESHPPEGWETNDLTDLPPEILSAKKLLSPDQGVDVTVIGTKVAASPAEMEEMMRGQLAGMKKKGFILERSEETTFQGFPARHLIGEFRSPEFEGAYLMDSYTVFSDAATVALAVSVDDARGGRELGADLAKWITIPGAPLVFTGSAPQRSDAYSMGEMIGKYLVYGVVVLAIVQIIRRRSSKRPRAERSM
jgi:hypothetical protein